MEYTSEFDRTTGICTVRVTGTFLRPDDSDKLKCFAVDFFTEHGCRMFLIDIRQAEVVGGTMGTYSAATPKGELAQALSKLRTAFVRQELTADDSFYENVAVTRGFQLRAFDTIERAASWLQKGNLRPPLSGR